MNPEKYNTTISRLDDQIRELTRKKRIALGKKKAAADLEVLGAFRRHHISPERYFLLSKLSQDQMEKLIDEAEAFEKESKEDEEKRSSDSIDEADKLVSFGPKIKDTEQEDIMKKIL